MPQRRANGIALRQMLCISKFSCEHADAIRVQRLTKSWLPILEAVAKVVYEICAAVDKESIIYGALQYDAAS